MSVEPEAPTEPACLTPEEIILYFGVELCAALYEEDTSC